MSFGRDVSGAAGAEDVKRIAILVAIVAVLAVGIGVIIGKFI